MAVVLAQSKQEFVLAWVPIYTEGRDPVAVLLSNAEEGMLELFSNEVLAYLTWKEVGAEHGRDCWVLVYCELYFDECELGKGYGIDEMAAVEIQYMDEM